MEKKNHPYISKSKHYCSFVDIKNIVLIISTLEKKMCANHEIYTIKTKLHWAGTLDCG